MRSVVKIMYERFLKDYQARFQDYPREPSLDLGLAVKQIRLRMGMTQEELARTAGMKPAALKTLENGYAEFTTWKNLLALSAALKTTPRDVLLEAAEWFQANFFVIKENHPPESTSAKRRPKIRRERWFAKETVKVEGGVLSFLSPPLLSPSHFCFMILEINPGKEIRDIRLPYYGKIAGFLKLGTLGIAFESSETLNLFANQGFLFQGDKTHRFINQDKANPLRLYLLFPAVGKKTVKTSKSKNEGLSVGKGIEKLRQIYSASKDRPLSFADFSDRTGLEEKSLYYLENTRKAEQVVYWDKIEKINRSLGLNLSQFLDLAEEKDEGCFRIATAHDRALIDYRHYHGVRMKSILPPGAQNPFHLSEMQIEPRQGLRRGFWKRQDQAMIGVYVEEGEILVEVGRNRKVLLQKEEGVYFDGCLRYQFTNQGKEAAKLIFAAHPAIIF